MATVGVKGLNFIQLNTLQVTKAKCILVKQRRVSDKSNEISRVICIVRGFESLAAVATVIA